MAPTADERRIRKIQALRDARDSGHSLGDVVKRNVDHTWATGGKQTAATLGLQPDHILIRGRFVVGTADVTPVAPHLIQKRGLQLRLLLLLIFDAQCRHGHGNRVRNVRKIHVDADEVYAPWTQMVLAPTHAAEGTGRGGRELRGRQITEALRALQDIRAPEIGGLLDMPKDSSDRRSYDQLELLSETGNGASYKVPDPAKDPNYLPIPKSFFTNLWVFGLTDIEIATYLMLAWLRRRFPSRHLEEGVYVTDETRSKVFGLTRTAYRSHTMLHRFRLIDRQPDPDRNYMTGRVTSFKTKYEKGRGSVRPWSFKLNDQALEQPALDTIHQVLTTPNMDDLRRLTGPW